jgi:ribosomal protein S18 acetylase RimI-like enzyme
MISVARLQAYLRNSARQRYDTVLTPPFTLFLHPSDTLTHFNYAMPDEPITDDYGPSLREPLATLRLAFLARDRQPRFEFIKEFAPALGPVLRIAGFIEEARQQLMICTPETYRLASDIAVAGLTITTLTADSSIAEAQDTLTAQRQGFDPDDTGPATEREAARFLRELGDGAAVLARLDGQPVGAGMFTAPLDGVAEVVGIATLEQFRRRGVGTAVTAQAVRTAFDRGIAVVCLTAADERAGRLYQRVGFRPHATMLAYVASD